MTKVLSQLSSFLGKSPTCPACTVRVGGFTFVLPGVSVSPIFSSFSCQGNWAQNSDSKNKKGGGGGREGEGVCRLTQNINIHNTF